MTDLNKSNQSDKSVDNRRSFLKKAGTASIIAALPVRNVWASYDACTISGAMSGNHSQQQTCTIQGRSPGYWHNYCDSRNRTYSVQGYGTSGSWGYSAENYPWKDVFGWGRSPFGGTSSRKGLHEFLPQEGSYNNYGGPDNINRHLVAAYYNAVNGFYPLQPGTSPEQYVQMLYDEAKRSGTYTVAQAIQDTYQ